MLVYHGRSFGVTKHKKQKEKETLPCGRATENMPEEGKGWAERQAKGKGLGCASLRWTSTDQSYCCLVLVYFSMLSGS